ncbi:APC family permease [Desulfosporosinus sp. SYSU MS00001]|uniref:APC family permease n=1 Tax=Desulfosporosinus sp. SYSU MS00001 TaxID=3416284 RepID=UPI003CF51F18
MVALGAASVVGSSWVYTSSSFFAEYGAGGEIFGFCIATVIAIFIALSYAELATIFPRAGGGVVYAYVAFGKKTSFVAGWALIGAYMAIIAFFVTASSYLLAKLIPQLDSGPFYTIAGVSVHLPELIFGVALTIVVFVFNYFGIRLASGVQRVMFSAMIIIGVILLVVGFSHGSASNFWPAFSSNMQPIPSVMRFMLPAMTYMTGFEVVAVLAEEANMSSRKIGLSVVLSVAMAGCFYVLVLLSSAFVIPWQQTATYKMGVIDSFTHAGFPALGYAAFAVSCLGLVSSFLGLFAAAPRLVLSLARANMLPKVF